MTEVAVNADEKRLLTRDTTENEMRYIATRAEEAAAAAAASEFGFTLEEAEAAEAASLADRDELVGEVVGEGGPEAESSEPAERASGQPSSSNLPQAEPSV